MSVEELDSTRGPVPARRLPARPHDVLLLEPSATGPPGGALEARSQQPQAPVTPAPSRRRRYLAAVTAFTVGLLVGGTGVHEWRDARSAGIREDTVDVALSSAGIRDVDAADGAHLRVVTRADNRGPLPVRIDAVRAAIPGVTVRDKVPSVTEVPAGETRSFILQIDLDCARVRGPGPLAFTVEAVPKSGRRQSVAVNLVDQAGLWRLMVHTACTARLADALTATYEGPAQPAGADAFALRLRIEAQPSVDQDLELTSLQLLTAGGPTLLHAGLPVTIGPRETVQLAAALPLPDCGGLSSFGVGEGLDLQYAGLRTSGGARLPNHAYAPLGVDFQRDLLAAVDARCGAAG